MRSFNSPVLCLVAALFLMPPFACTANYDEDKVPAYTLPDPLVMADGRKVTSAAMWRKERRPEVLKLFETHMYGRSPGRPKDMTFKVLSTDKAALGGKAIRREVRVNFTGRGDGPGMTILIYLPAGAGAKKQAPIFVGLNFYGNHSIQADPAITLSREWMRSNQKKGVVDHKATEKSRGTSASRWPVANLLKRGFGVATIYCGDIDPDFHDEFKNGVHAMYAKKGQEGHAPDAWGTIGAWAWGLSRAMDYFETDKCIDAKRVAVMGHSRLGKTSLWAGAQDERFALVISNNSGCGGAALSRRAFGETVKRINTSFPHWFCGNFKQYNDNEGKLPLDQHMLVALMAPRPVYVASAVGDRWADPRGEFLSAKHAGPVYRLLGEPACSADTMPAVDKPAMGGRVGYHIRTGRHDVKDFDWNAYMDFFQQHLSRR